MAFTNFENKEINCKILYVGPSGAGKSTNLRAIFNQTAPEARTGMVELKDGPAAPSLFFEFLPISIGFVRDWHVKLHLYTLPAQSLYETVPSIITKGIDGYIFVADSMPEKFPANIEALQSLRKLFIQEGQSQAEMPAVVQYNKRDLPGMIPVEVMRSELNPTRLPDFEASAKNGRGVLESLHEIAIQVIRRLAG